MVHLLSSLITAGRRSEARSATLAVGRTLLQLAYHMIQRQQAHVELGANYLDALNKVQLAKHLAKRLEGLGFAVQATERDGAATFGSLNALAA